ncbi:MAG: type II toxin-antitoxin system RelE/ParE family toxin [Halothiobacillaceae bacterium]
MRVVLRPEAQQELLQAQVWYESKIPGLGFEFARAADAAIASACRHPQSYMRIDGDFRRVLLRKFPYALIYLPSPDELLVVAFFHQQREPGTWVERLNG